MLAVDLAAAASTALGFCPYLLDIDLHLLCKLLEFLREVLGLHLLNYLLGSQSVSALSPLPKHHSSIVCAEWIYKAVWSHIMYDTPPDPFYAVVVIIHKMHSSSKYGWITI